MIYNIYLTTMSSTNLEDHKLNVPEYLYHDCKNYLRVDTSNLPKKASAGLAWVGSPEIITGTAKLCTTTVSVFKADCV